MILTNRLFERKLPSRDAKSIFIFCEGFRREYDYFTYFKEKDSRINIEVHKISPSDDNSPRGLYRIAEKMLISSKENGHNPKYSTIEGDEVWIVLDTDPDKKQSRNAQISEVRVKCSSRANWLVVESDPCFEVWLYYHHNKLLPQTIPDNCKSWKNLVNAILSGGFDSRKHPIYIEEAMNNAKEAHNRNQYALGPGHTEVYKLGQSISNILAEKIRQIKSRI